MLLTIAGAPGSGKTAFATFLNQKYQFQMVDIRDLFYASLPAEAKSVSKLELLKLFYSSTEAGCSCHRKISAENLRAV